MGTAWEDLRGRKQRQTLKLREVADVTRQIAEAVERGDSVAAQMLLDEREQPVRELSELEEEIREYIHELPETEAIRVGELLRGEEPEDAEEKAFAEQTAQFRRILSSVLELDERVSLRVGGNRSFYRTFRA